MKKIIRHKVGLVRQNFNIISKKIFFCSVVMKNFEIIALSLNRMFDIAPFLVSKPFFLEELMPSLGK